FHSPRRGAFHHSLTVLCAIGRLRYLALEGGPPCFRRDFACPAVLPDSWLSPVRFPYGTLALCGGPFQWPSGTRWISDSVWALPSPVQVRPTPSTHRRQAVPGGRFRLFPFRSPLLREYSLFLEVLRCFSSPGALLLAYVFSQG